MEFTKTLLKGKLVKRYKRFFADVKLNKEIITARRAINSKNPADKTKEVVIFNSSPSS